MTREHTPYHPKWYRERVPIFWWLAQGAYLKFIARELTSVLVAYVAIVLVALVVAIDRGEAAYLAFTDWLTRPVMVVCHVLVLLGLLFHTVTWLNLAPLAVVPKIGGRTVPARVVLVSHYAAWIVCTAVVAWVLLGR